MTVSGCWIMQLHTCDTEGVEMDISRYLPTWSGGNGGASLGPVERRSVPQVGAVRRLPAGLVVEALPLVARVGLPTVRKR